MLVFRIKWVILRVYISVVLSVAEYEDEDKYIGTSTQSCILDNEISCTLESVTTTSTEEMSSLTGTTKLFDFPTENVPITVEVYPTRIKKDQSTTSIEISSSSSLTPTETVLLEGSMPIIQTTIFTTAEDKLESDQLPQSITNAEQNILSTIPTLAESESTIQPTKTITDTSTGSIPVTATAPIHTVATLEIDELTDTTALTDEKEFIAITDPPTLIQPVRTTTSTDAIARFECTVVESSTAPSLVVLETTALPATEHTGAIEPTSVGDIEVITNGLLITTTAPILNTVGTSLVNSMVEPTNTSVVPSESTATPSLPTNIAKVIVL